MSQSTSVPQAITIAVASARARPHPQSRPPQFIANPTPCPSRVRQPPEHSRQAGASTSVSAPVHSLFLLQSRPPEPVDSLLPTLAPVVSASHQSILVRRARQHPSEHPSSIPHRLYQAPVHRNTTRHPTLSATQLPTGPFTTKLSPRSPHPMSSGTFAQSSSTGSSTAFAIFMAAQAIGCIVLAFATGHSFVIAPAALVPIVYGWAAAATAAPYQGGVRPLPLHTTAPEARHQTPSRKRHTTAPEAPHHC
mgnify:CR=1 FL=1